MKPILTIDPGANGGICLKMDKALRCYKMPASLTGKAVLLTALRLKVQGKLEVVIEDVGFHVEGNRAQGSVKLARHVGQLEGIFAKLNVKVEYVRPVKWMEAFPDRPKSLVKHEKITLKAEHPSYSAKQFQKLVADVNASRKRRRKAYIKDAVMRAFPKVRVFVRMGGSPRNAVTDYVSDALGILLWAQERKPKELPK